MADREPEPDDELPELTLEQLKNFKTLAQLREEQRRAEHNKQTVSVRLSPQAYRKAQALGKGYTSVLARMLEYCLNDAELIKKCL